MTHQPTGRKRRFRSSPKKNRVRNLRGRLLRMESLDPRIMLDGAGLLEADPEAAIVGQPVAGTSLSIDDFLGIPQGGSEGNIYGTLGDDLFEFSGGPTSDAWVVKLNGVVQEVGQDVTQVKFDGVFGSDSVVITGTAAADSAELWPDHALFEGDGYSVSVSNVKSTTINGGGGDDTADMYGAAGSDSNTFKATPAYGRLYGNGFANRVNGFSEVIGHSVGNNDVAKLYDSAGDDAFGATPEFANLYGEGFDNTVIGFRYVHAYAKAGGQDVAELYDSPGKDTLVAKPTFSKLSGPGFSNRAVGFEQILADAAQGGLDVAKLYDSAGDDAFGATPEFANLYGEGFDNTVIGFRYVHAYAKAGGQDVAELYDSPGKDTLVAKPTFSKLSGPGFSNRAVGFEQILADAAQSGLDVAKLHDSAGDDVFEATPEHGKMQFGGSEDCYAQATGFRYVHAYAQKGGNDTASLHGATGQKDKFRGYAGQSKVYGEGFFHRAKGFETVDLNAVDAENEVAQLYDSSGSDTFEARPDLARMTYDAGNVVNANDFRYVHAYAKKGGNDVAELYDSPGDDVLDAKATVSKLYGPGFSNRAVGFETVHAEANAGGQDVAKLYDSPANDTLIAKPGHVVLAGAGVFREAISFRTVHVQPDSAGFDVAYLENLVLTHQPEANPEQIRLSNSNGSSHYVISLYDHLMVTNHQGNVIYQQDDFREDAQMLAESIQAGLHEIVETAKVEKEYAERMARIAEMETAKRAEAEEAYNKARTEAIALSQAAHEREVARQQSRMEAKKERFFEYKLELILMKARISIVKGIGSESGLRSAAKACRELVHEIELALDPPTFSGWGGNVTKKIIKGAEDALNYAEWWDIGGDSLSLIAKQIKSGEIYKRLTHFDIDLGKACEKLHVDIPELEDHRDYLKRIKLGTLADDLNDGTIPKINIEMDALRGVAGQDKLADIEALGDAHLPSIGDIASQFPDALDGLSSISIPSAEDIFSQIVVDNYTDLVQILADGEDWVRGILGDAIPIPSVQDVIDRILGAPGRFKDWISDKTSDTENFRTPSLHDPGLSQFVRPLIVDSNLDRNEMLQVFSYVAADNTVTHLEHSDLWVLVLYAKDGIITMPDHVLALADKVINGDRANASFQEDSLGNLAGGSTGDHLNSLVDKWFLGLDHPSTTITETNDDGTIVTSTTWAYSTTPVSQPLFGASGVQFTDVDQGSLGDCYFLAGLASVACQDSDIIQDMFIDNGDGTFTVRFYNNGVADYVTVDQFLPVDGSASPSVFANASSVLWVALAEKAYAQVNESGWIGQNGENEYGGIHSGYRSNAISHITGLSYWDASVNESGVVAAFNAGEFVTMGTPDAPAVLAPQFVNNHGYALVGHDPLNRQFTFWNPHGDSVITDMVTATWVDIALSMGSWSHASSSAATFQIVGEAAIFDSMTITASPADLAAASLFEDVDFSAPFDNPPPVRVHTTVPTANSGPQARVRLAKMDSQMQSQEARAIDTALEQTDSLLWAGVPKATEEAVAAVFSDADDLLIDMPLTDEHLEDIASAQATAF